MNKKRRMTMQTANGGKEEMQGCVEYLELEVGGVKTYAYAFVVQLAPYQLLLGRPWQKRVKLEKIEREDGSMEVEISDPGEGGKRVVVPTRERRGKRLKSSMLAVEKRSRQEREGFKFDEEPGRSGFGEEAKTSFASVSMDVGTGRCASGAMMDVLKLESERDRVEREETEDGTDKVMEYGIGMASRLEEGSEKMMMNDRGDVRCIENVILEEREGEEGNVEGVECWVDRVVGSGVWAADQLVEEKEMGILDTGEDARRDKNIVLERKEENDILTSSLLVTPPEQESLYTSWHAKFRTHDTGSARMEGYYRITHAEKAEYVAQYQQTTRMMNVSSTPVVEDFPSCQ